MWLTRDYNGTLRLHVVKPIRQGHVWHTDTYFGSPQSITLREDIMPNLKWTDNPVEVSVINKKK